MTQKLKGSLTISIFRHRNMKKKRNPQRSKTLISLSFFQRGYCWSRTPTPPSPPPWPGTAGCSSHSRSWTTPSWWGSTTSTRRPRSARRRWRTSPLSRSLIRSPGPRGERDWWRTPRPWRAFRCCSDLVEMNATLTHVCNRRQVTRWTCPPTHPQGAFPPGIIRGRDFSSLSESLISYNPTDSSRNLSIHSRPWFMMG